MTREQVLINHIQEYLDSGMWQYEACYLNKDDLKVIIKALEQEPCEDAISRQTLIERINNAEEIFKSDNMESIASDDGDPFVDGVLSGVFSIRQMVIQAPSVMPQHTEAEMTETKGAE